MLAGLRAFGQVNRRFTRQGGYIDFAAERRRHDADRHVAVQVVAIALKNVVLLEADFNVQITRGAAVGARLTIARAANAHAVVDTGRNFDFQGFLALDLSLTRAGGAGIGNDLAHTAASRAGLLHAEKALAHLHRTRAAAGAARFDLRAGFGAGARADFAVLVRRNSNLRVLAVGCFFQRELHGIAQVATTKHLASAARTSTLLAEHIAKNIAKRLGKTTKAFGAGATTHIGVHTGMTVLVVGRALLRVRQHFIGLFGLFEFRFGVFGGFTLVAVRVELHGQLAVGLFNFLFGRVLGNAQNLVKISFGHANVCSVATEKPR